MLKISDGALALGRCRSPRASRGRAIKKIENAVRPARCTHESRGPKLRRRGPRPGGERLFRVGASPSPCWRHRPGGGRHLDPAAQHRLSEIASWRPDVVLLPAWTDNAARTSASPAGRRPAQKGTITWATQYRRAAITLGR